MTTRWKRAYPPEDEQVHTVRAEVAGQLVAAGVGPPLRRDALLAVGELVTNAILHAGTEFTVGVEVSAERVRIEVGDGNAQPPVLMVPDPDATTGRGLVIVAAVASAWGFETADHDGIAGKVVWAEFMPGGHEAAG